MAKVMINLVPFDTNHLVIGKIAKTDGILWGPNGEDKVVDGYGFMIWDEREGHPDQYGTEIVAHAWSLVYQNEKTAIEKQLELMQWLNEVDKPSVKDISSLKFYI